MKKIIVTTLLLSAIVYGSTGEEIAKKAGCLHCHVMDRRSIAPAFLGIVRHNIRLNPKNARAKMIHAIKYGSHGEYRHYVSKIMPAHPNLSDKEINTLVSWMLDSYKNYMSHNQ